MPNTGDGAQPAEHVQEPRSHWWSRLIAYPKRKFHEQRAKKQNESPADRAARRTANATVWMAIFTVILAFISIGTLLILKNQLREMHEGGIDTHALAEATGKMKDSADRNATAAENFSASAAGINTKLETAVGKLNDQAAAMKDLAGEAKTQAQEAKVAADAAKSAAETAKESLHVSQRAYLIMGSPAFNLDTNVVSIPILNVGHIPSGQITVAAHEATLAASSDDPSLKHDPIEAKSVGFSTFSIDPNPGAERSMNIPVPKVIPTDFMGNKQQVIITGRMNYNDGFRDDPLQTEDFCFAGLYFSSLKKVSWIFCDPAQYIKEISEAEAKAAQQHPN